MQVPQVLSLEDRSKSGLFDGSCAQSVSWLARTVELVVELVVDIDVSCCLLDHFVSDPRGTGVVLINLCSSRHRKGRMSSFWEPQSSQGHQSCSNQIKGSKSNRKGKERRIYGQRGEFCIVGDWLLPRSRSCQGHPGFSVDSLCS